MPISTQLISSWKVLLADDDPFFQKVGRSLLDGISFDGHVIETFSSTDFKSTCQFIADNPDTALIILDVHMDEPTTGYEVIEYVREELQNNEVRILLHTSDRKIQSEDSALDKYAISAYLSKIDSRPTQLLIKVKIALRSYKDIRHIKKLTQSKTDLENEIDIRTRQLLDLSAKLQIEIGIRKKAEASLKDINNNLEDEVARRTEDAELAKIEAIKASKGKSEFLSRMSHELRTPLNAILGFSQLLIQDKKHTLEERQTESVDQIIIAGKHLLYLVEEVLDLSRIEAGKLKVNNDGVNICPIILDGITTMTQMASLRNINLLFETTDKECWVLGDGNRIKQIILNLISNAIKYGPENSDITLSNKLIKATNTEDKDRVEVNVHDQGDGISSDKLQYLFKPFERCEDSASDIEGTGVGLAICKRLMELMNGSVEYQKPAFGGCNFVLNFSTPH